jgi:hypothetical protein
LLTRMSMGPHLFLIEENVPESLIIGFVAKIFLAVFLKGFW